MDEVDGADGGKAGTVTRCGYAAVVGRPNVGKSTLVNGILGRKVSAVTPKPNTTRNRVLAVWTRGDAQIAFLDTPGVHRPRSSLGRYMLDAAAGAIAETDVVVWLLDASAGDAATLFAEERDVVDRLTAAGKPVVALLNKIDLLREKAVLLPMLEAVSAVEGVVAAIPISALGNDGVDGFLDAVVPLLPEGPHLYPEDMISDRAERFFVAELVREALTELLHAELPYRTAVVVERFVEEKDRCSVNAVIHVEKDSQKGIVIGRNGAMIGEIRERARVEAARMLGVPIELRLHVVVTPGWSESPAGLRKMGYE
ncbi:MAG: GTPase Era [Proteobacteria bacterium]|nr:GTPase Era [Pseudomonadota bacterium]